MVDLYGKEKGNISLPERLQPPDLTDEDLDDEAFKVVIVNMQKAVYDARIADIQQRIERMQKRNDDLLNTCETTDSIIYNSDIDSADDIAQLNRLIRNEMETIQEHRKKIDTVEKWRIEERETHVEKVNEIDRKFRRTRVELTSKIKELNAKINNLEDYKNTRASLWEKLQSRDEAMVEKEKNVQWQLSQIERKFKIDREKYKSEMHARLFGSAGKFQLEIANVIPVPIHRLRRENIALKNELECNVKGSLAKKETITEIKQTLPLIQHWIKGGHAERTEALTSSKVKDCILDALRRLKKRVHSHLISIPRLTEVEEKEFNDSLEKIKLEAKWFELCKSQLEVFLHREQVRLNFAKRMEKFSRLEVKKTQDILRDSKDTLDCTLTLEGPEDIIRISRYQVLHYLLDILKKSLSVSTIDEMISMESVTLVSDAYAVGDLGFDPTHINLEMLHKKETLSEIC